MLTLLQVILQIVAMLISWGSGSEMVVMPLGAALGVWLVGFILGRLGLTRFGSPRVHLLGALLGAGLGAVGMWLASSAGAALGFWPFLALPLLAVGGYYLLPKTAPNL